MRVVTLIGTKAGQVIDLPVPAALACLADGRARPVDDNVAEVPPPVLVPVAPSRPIDARAARKGRR